MTARNPQNLQPGDRVRLVGPGWGSHRHGQEATIDHIDPQGQARFGDEEDGQNHDAYWIADEQLGGRTESDPVDTTWAVHVIARAMPASEPVESPITEVDTVLTAAIRDMTNNPYPVEPGVPHRQTKPQAYMDQREFWLNRLAEDEPASVDIFLENYPPRTDFEGRPGEPRVFSAAEEVAAGLVELIPAEFLKDQLGDFTPKTTKRRDILSTADNLIHGDREDDYGRPIDSFRRVAQAMNVVLEGEGHPPISATTAAKLMIALKLSRLSGGDNKDDTWIDLAGYAALGAEVHEQEAAE
ncbi:hypothetical protein PBI_BRAHMS_24 [Microbacterium phage Brahms]|uniref:DUF6378 domain-containing protein n=1 Tax=Microbacterium phage Brahms TaxID=2419973 RepID=A0A3G2KA92_9CAUD|nr:hypothetical protein PBI_BRAHMS_24 [Microbacterium phage Brahms]